MQTTIIFLLLALTTTGCTPFWKEYSANWLHDMAEEEYHNQDFPIGHKGPNNNPFLQ